MESIVTHFEKTEDTMSPLSHIWFGVTLVWALTLYFHDMPALSEAMKLIKYLRLYGWQLMMIVIGLAQLGTTVLVVMRFDLTPNYVVFDATFVVFVTCLVSLSMWANHNERLNPFMHF